MAEQHKRGLFSIIPERQSPVLVKKSDQAELFRSTMGRSFAPAPQSGSSLSSQAEDSEPVSTSSQFLQDFSKNYPIGVNPADARNYINTTIADAYNGGHFMDQQGNVTYPPRNVASLWQWYNSAPPWHAVAAPRAVTVPQDVYSATALLPVAEWLGRAAKAVPQRLRNAYGAMRRGTPILREFTAPVPLSRLSRFIAEKLPVIPAMMYDYSFDGRGSAGNMYEAALGRMFQNQTTNLINAGMSRVLPQSAAARLTPWVGRAVRAGGLPAALALDAIKESYAGYSRGTDLRPDLAWNSDNSLFTNLGNTAGAFRRGYEANRRDYLRHLVQDDPTRSWLGNYIADLSPSLRFVVNHPTMALASPIIDLHQTLNSFGSADQINRKIRMNREAVEAGLNRNLPSTVRQHYSRVYRGSTPTSPPVVSWTNTGGNSLPDWARIAVKSDDGFGEYMTSTLPNDVVQAIGKEYDYIPGQTSFTAPKLLIEARKAGISPGDAEALTAFVRRKANPVSIRGMAAMPKTPAAGTPAGEVKYTPTNRQF